MVRELHREGELPRGDPHPCVRETSREGTAEDLVFVLRGGEDDVRDVAADGGEELEALLRGGDGVVDPQTTVTHANHRHAHVGAHAEVQADALLLLEHPHAVGDELAGHRRAGKERRQRERESRHVDVPSLGLERVVVRRSGG